MYIYTYFMRTLEETASIDKIEKYVKFVESIAEIIKKCPNCSEEIRALRQNETKTTTGLLRNE